MSFNKRNVTLVTYNGGLLQGSATLEGSTVTHLNFRGKLTPLCGATRMQLPISKSLLVDCSRCASIMERIGPHGYNKLIDGDLPGSDPEKMPDWLVINVYKHLHEGATDFHWHRLSDEKKDWWREEVASSLANSLRLYEGFLGRKEWREYG